MTPVIRVLGAGAVVTELRHVAERVKDAARKQMHRSAERILAKARLQAPRETGALEKSLRIETSYEYGSGRLELDVVVGDDGTDQYALIMHEGEYNLGPISQAKQDMNPGVKVGPKFLERAANEEERRIDGDMISEVTKAINL